MTDSGGGGGNSSSSSLQEKRLVLTDYTKQRAEAVGGEPRRLSRKHPSHDSSSKKETGKAEDNPDNDYESQQQQRVQEAISTAELLLNLPLDTKGEGGDEESMDKEFYLKRNQSSSGNIRRTFRNRNIGNDSFASLTKATSASTLMAASDFDASLATVRSEPVQFSLRRRGADVCSDAIQDKGTNRIEGLRKALSNPRLMAMGAPVLVNGNKSFSSLTSRRSLPSLRSKSATSAMENSFPAPSSTKRQSRRRSRNKLMADEKPTGIDTLSLSLISAIDAADKIAESTQTESTGAMTEELDNLNVARSWSNGGKRSSSPVPTRVISLEEPFVCLRSSKSVELTGPLRRRNPRQLNKASSCRGLLRESALDNNSSDTDDDDISLGSFMRRGHNSRGTTKSDPVMMMDDSSITSVGSEMSRSSIRRGSISGISQGELFMMNKAQPTRSKPKRNSNPDLASFMRRGNNMMSGSSVTSSVGSEMCMSSRIRRGNISGLSQAEQFLSNAQSTSSTPKRPQSKYSTPKRSLSSPNALWTAQGKANSTSNNNISSKNAQWTSTRGSGASSSRNAQWTSSRTSSSSTSSTKNAEWTSARMPSLSSLNNDQSGAKNSLLQLKDPLSIPTSSPSPRKSGTLLRQSGSLGSLPILKPSSSKNDNKDSLRQLRGTLSNRKVPPKMERSSAKKSNTLRQSGSLGSLSSYLPARVDAANCSSNRLLGDASMTDDESEMSLTLFSAKRASRRRYDS